MSVDAHRETLSLADFVHRWQHAQLSEKSAAQSHFIELCHVLREPTPTAADQTGDYYTFEKKVRKTSGGKGFADVWYRGHFGWEYKAPGGSLEKAYAQLADYREDLENPPLLIVSDLQHFEVHTNFTGTIKKVYPFAIGDLLSQAPVPGTTLTALQVLRAAFEDPWRLEPNRTATLVTEQAAREFARLADSLRARGVPAHDAAHFLIRLLFCLFAEDIGLLPERLFTRLVENTGKAPDSFGKRASQLFDAMKTGGDFGVETIPHFNGGLFEGGDALDLTRDDLAILLRACALDWSSVEPAIFGNLFERSLDPSKRAQLGAHYTSKDDILLVVEPVLMAPLRREWEQLQTRLGPMIEKRDASSGSARTRLDNEMRELLVGFAGRLTEVRVLDPACGSGNFLYVALKLLLDLEHDVVTFASVHQIGSFFPRVRPEQLHGIEVNEYAHELAQVVIWIGYIQWLRDHNFGIPDDPILKRLHTIEQMDAIVGHDEQGALIEPVWPDTDAIVGNPPFLGGKLLRTELGDAYVDSLFALYRGGVPREADLVLYWFERAREQIIDGKAKRAGLLATNSIRGGANRRVLQRIKETGDIFFAWSDRPWVVDGAAVRVSMIGFDIGEEANYTLNGLSVAAIHADLTGFLDLTRAERLRENRGLAFMGDTKVGPFDIPREVARSMLAATGNPNGRPNSDVVVPWMNGLDVTRRPRDMWIIDFGIGTPEHDAALYEMPFEFVRRHVKPYRATAKSGDRTGVAWWLHQRPRPDMRKTVGPLDRFITTPTVAKHRIFVWLQHPTVPDHQLIVIARDDDYFFGVLHSKIHELWTLRMGTWLGVGNDPRYTPSTTFETFPFPWRPGEEPAGDPRVEAVAAAASDLVEKRERWLNPSDADESELKGRTLTNLYNQGPAWLDFEHRRLDETVLDAYGWPRDLTDDQILEHLLDLNLSRAVERGQMPDAVEEAV